MDPTEKMIAMLGDQARELAKRDELLARAAEVLERNAEALERADTQREALRRLTRFVFAEPKTDDLAFYATKFCKEN